MSIKETIEKLDELMQIGKTLMPGDLVWVAFEAVPVLRNAALAGEALAEAVEKSQKDSGWCADCLAKIDCKEALAAYRSAVKESEPTSKT